MVERSNKVFIATSIDGYIADRNGGLDWLNEVPNPDGIDMGYGEFIKGIDAVVMGRKTFETVCGFDIDWPYTVPVFVISNSLKSIPVKYSGFAELVSGSLREILDLIHKKDYNNLYIDGGTTIQGFLREDLIDEMTITTIPVLLGGGARLFSDLPDELKFELAESKVFLGQIVQNCYTRLKT
jgi:dihydrofolate reductase